MKKNYNANRKKKLKSRIKEITFFLFLSAVVGAYAVCFAMGL